ncbi:MAG TPA: type II secretion system F family protein [Bryobacteraceae bacterium]|jgi:tight adherence protein B|nr:type II secretion system F family protein [Bryobacteraceae bacterium]
MSAFIGIVVAVWLAALAIWLSVSKFVRNSDVDRIRTRLSGAPGKQKKAAEDPSRRSIIQQDRREGHLIQRLLKKYNLLTRLELLIEQAGLKWHPVRMVHGSLALLVAGSGLGWMFLPGKWSRFLIIPGLIAAATPMLYLLKTRRARLRKFEEIFPESLEFVARSMRAGHAFSASLEMIHREFQEPLAGEFRRTFEEHNLGLPLEMALQKLAQRVPSLDVHFFVSAVLLQKRTGGNLAEILDKLAYIIRERFKLRGRIRAISAHGRMTGTALSLIPVVVAVLMFFANPDYIRFFFLDETGNYMMGGAILLQIIGYAVMKKIVSIEV